MVGAVRTEHLTLEIWCAPFDSLGESYVLFFSSIFLGLAQDIIKMLKKRICTWHDGTFCCKTRFRFELVCGTTKLFTAKLFPNDAMAMFI